MTDTTHTGLRAQIEPMVNKLRAAASSRKLTSAEIFTMTDPIMDAMARYSELAPPAPQETVGEPMAWAEVYSGKIATLALQETRFCNVPLYTHPTPTSATTDTTALVEALETALRDIALEAEAPQQHYDRNGPTWTTRSGAEHEDTSSYLEKCNGIAEKARAALTKRKD